MPNSVSNEKIISGIYVAMYERAADKAGFDQWVVKANGLRAAGKAEIDIATTMSAQLGLHPAFTTIYGSLGDAAFIDAIYMNIGGKPADAAGRTNWLNKLTDPTNPITRAQLVGEFVYTILSITPAELQAMKDAGKITATELTDALARQDRLINKSDVAAVFTHAMGAGSNLSLTADEANDLALLNKDPAFLASKAIIKGVTEDDATKTAPTDYLNGSPTIDGINQQFGGGTVPGKTFTLTVGMDNASGSLINGSQLLSAGTFVDTLNNSDSLTGTAGTTDRLYAELSGSTTTTPTSVKGIEIIDVTNTNRNTAGVSELNLVNGDALVTTVKSSNNANALTINNIGSAPTAFELSTTAQNFTANVLASKLSGTADAATLTLTNVTAGTTTLAPTAAGSGYETINIVSNGSVKNGDTTDLVLNDGVGTSLATVNVSGANNLDIDFTPTTITKVDASTFTGQLDVDFANGNAQNVSVKGGKANDTIEVGATAGDYTANDTIDGGEGTSDKLVLVNADATNATATQSNVSNIEVIGLVDGISGAINLTRFGATGLQFGANAAAASTVTYAAGTSSTLDFQNFLIGGAFNLGVTVNGTATTDVMALTLGTTAAASGNNAATLTFTGVETLNVLSRGGANTLTSLTLTNTAAQEKVVVTGNQTLTLATTTIADAIDASGMTGSAQLIMGGNTNTLSMTITGTANADTLIGGTAADIITGGAGNDTIQNVATGTNAAAGDVLIGGTGNDTLVVRGSLASEAVATAYAKAANLTDFTVGTSAAATDVLTLTATEADYGAGAAASNLFATAATTEIQNVAQNAAVAGVVAGADLIKLTTGVATTGLTVQQAFNAAIGTATVTGFTAADDVFVSFFDTTNNKMVIGLVDVGADTILATADVIQLVGTVDMTAADYATFSATNFDIIA